LQAGGVAPTADAFEAFFATPWLGIVALLLWTVVPVTFGYWRFRAADL
jgi:ABC-type transport system involved in multi-copper enzyme maturation permease subunit